YSYESAFRYKIKTAALLITWIGLRKLQHEAQHRLVLVVIILKLLQGGQQCIPPTFGDTDGEHDEEGIKTALLHNYAVFCQVFGYDGRSEEHTSELQSRENLVCRLLLEKKKKKKICK